MEFILALLAFMLLFFGMAVGVIFRGKPLKGSCGGIAALMGTGKCDLCGGDPNRCDEVAETTGRQNNDLAYDATRTDNRQA